MSAQNVNEMTGGGASVQLPPSVQSVRKAWHKPRLMRLPVDKTANSYVTGTDGHGTSTHS
ncbi:MAG: hypothetical protein JXQ84_05235 [Rhodospirillaceae bacterium]|nr:hypothetical protein [Rhodospirillaceae bacterium]